MKGSMTVEAAYLFPFCFIVIIIVCYLGVFQYNQAILKMTGYECILRTMEERVEEDHLLKENLLQRATEFGMERTLGVKDLQVSVKVTATKISLTYHCIQSLIESPLEVTIAYERTYPELTLRAARAITGD